MLRYGGYTWLLDVRDSPIQVRIGPGCRSSSDLHWQVDLHYIAAGQEWRRVKSWLRPTLRFCVYGFAPGVSDWRDLEGLSLTSEEAHGGTLFLNATNWNVPSSSIAFGPHQLVFGRRQGCWFTTEFAAIGACRAPQPACATNAHGPEFGSSALEPLESDEPGEAIYAVEDLPFGLVEVASPVNARCPENYAKAHAQSLLGLRGETSCDFGPRLVAEGKELQPVAGDDWRVRLHHGGTWTHFTL